MKNLSELKQHLNAVEQTRQITNAMYLLSTSRMKKSMQNINFNLMYLKRLRATMKDILSKSKRNDVTNPFIEFQEQGKPLFFVITSDKGMCGGYNSNIVNLAFENMEKYDDPILCSLGLIGTEIFENHGIKPAYKWYGASQKPTIYLARDAAEKITEFYENHIANEVFIVYTKYVNSAVQVPVCKRILPLLRRDFADIEYEYEYTAQPIYEPSAQKVFDQMVPNYLVGFMYDVFMQSATCENYARMNAMQNATKNADEMISKLSTEINAARQLEITNEITEIAAASEVSDTK